MTQSPYAADYYERLGVDRTSDSRLIRRQYRLLARLYHPDVNTSSDAPERFLDLREAYNILINDQARADYDQWLDTDLRGQKPLQLSLRLWPSALNRAAGTQRVYALLDLSVQGQVQSTSAPLNIVLVLDRSLSMKGRRLHYVKEAAKRIISSLSPQDTFGVVAFNDRAHVVHPCSPATDPAIAHGAITSIQPAGGTELASGLKLGFQEAIRNHAERSISHVILLTDGRTYGDEEIAMTLVAKAAEQQIGLTAMGLGTDWNDQFLDELARRANGSSHFISDPAQAVDLFQTQLQQLQRTFARGAELHLEFPDGVTLIQAHEVKPGLRPLPYSDGSIAVGALPVDPPLQLLLDLRVEQPDRDILMLGRFALRAEVVQSAMMDRLERLALIDVSDDETEAPPDEIYRMAQRVATLRLQERTWNAIEKGESDTAAAALEQLADRFLEIGANELALATQREMEIFQRTGTLSEDGRKVIKYGTRMLSLPSPVESGS